MEFFDSSEFPLYSNTRSKPKFNNIFNRQVKQFPNKRFEINGDLPSYFQLPSVYKHDRTKQNIYNLLPCERREKMDMTNIKQVIHKNDLDTFSIIKQNTPKQGRLVLKSVEKADINLPILIKPNDSHESGYLKNVNEYSIRENYQVNDDRVIRFIRRPVKDFNVVNNKEKIIRPPSIKGDKWGAFYDSYVYLASTKQGFRKKQGMFSDYLDQSNINCTLQKFFKKPFNNQLGNDSIILTTEESTSNSVQLVTPIVYNKGNTKSNLLNDSKNDLLKSKGIKLNHKIDTGFTKYAKRVLSPRNTKSPEKNFTNKSKEIIIKNNLTKLDRVINGSIFKNNN